MAIHPVFGCAVVGFLTVLASGLIAPVAADSLSIQQAAAEHSTANQRDDLSEEQPLIDPSSVRAWLPIDTGPGHTGYPLVLNSQVQHFLDRFTRERRDVVGVWLDRSSRYLGMIREVFRSRGMPEDLAFTAMIESGFNPVAVSRAGAVGLWQFMAATARRYGLRVDGWVDERRDPEKSTFAAVAYLRDLYTQFGSWWLAQAAYNAGEMNVVKAIRATGSDDFWVLASSRFLHRETKEFVPQIQAATMIGRDPSRYGFDLTESTMTAFETVTAPPSTSLRWLADAARIPHEALATLNPSLIRGTTPPGQPYALKVPLGTGTAALIALETPRRAMVAARPARVARVAAKPKAASRDLARAAVRAPAGKPGLHVVRPRDTVSAIAKRYGVSVGDLVRWNSLEKSGRIRPGDRLRVTDSRLPSERQAAVR